MPSAPLRTCSGGCGALVIKGRCPACARVPEQARGTSTERGYGAVWRAFRGVFISRLVTLGIPPVCGAALPDGPKTAHSRCRAERLETWRSADGSDLHLDHEPGLQPHERSNTLKVCDPLRIQLLCAACHTAKTATTS